MAEIVHLIRHGQSTFNAAWELEKKDPMIIDAPLTGHGQDQAAGLRDTVAQLGLDAIIASPLTRALQTATSIADGLSVPIHVDSLHREYVWSSCDLGRSPVALAQDFPHLAFDHLSDPWWWCPSGNPTHLDREPPEVVMNRVHAFHAALKAHPERSVAIVGHCTFFWLFSGVMLQNCEVLSINPHQHMVPEAPPPPPGL